MLTYQELKMFNNNLGLQTNRSTSGTSENSSDELLINGLVNRNVPYKKQDSNLHFSYDEFLDSSVSDNEITKVSSDYASSSLLNSISDSNISMNSSTFKTLSDDSSKSNDIIEKSNYYSHKNECNKFSNDYSKAIKYHHKEEVKGKSYTIMDNTVYRPNESDQDNKSKNDFVAESSVCDIDVKFKKMTISPQSSSIKQNLASREFSKPAVRRKRNLTFNRQELIKIERDNSILLKKIINLSKPRTVALNQSFTHKMTSAAINRTKQQKKIDKENVILSRKINEMGRAKTLC